MIYTGVIIEESLGDKTVLSEVVVVKTKISPVTHEDKTPWLKQWTLHTVEIAPNKADAVAQKISKSFDPVHPDWYADYRNNLFHYIIFPNKIFRVDLQNPVFYKEARSHGISIGIPEYQVNFEGSV